jgi:uncharacterized membrane protein YczE
VSAHSRRREARPELEVIGLPSLAELRRRLPRLIVGVVCLGVGIAMTLDASLGLSPWDVLHQGLSDRTGLSFGTVVVGLGLLVLLLWIPLGQRLGIGTVVNTLSVGYVVDATRALSPDVHSLAARWLLLAGGILVVALGIGLYIGSGLGPGPRDGLMTGLAARGLPLWAVRTGLELSALLAGWLLGGDVGVGTVAFAFGIGPLGHWFLVRLHLGVAGVDPDPAAQFGE